MCELTVINKTRTHAFYVLVSYSSSFFLLVCFVSCVFVAISSPSLLYQRVSTPLGFALDLFVVLRLCTHTHPITNAPIASLRCI